MEHNRTTYTLCRGIKRRDPESLWMRIQRTCTSDNPGISIEYNVRVINDVTGEVIPSGTTVPVGTIVRYEFVSHEYTDIYWFGTGGSLELALRRLGRQEPRDLRLAVPRARTTTMTRDRRRLQCLNAYASLSSSADKRHHWYLTTYRARQPRTTADAVRCTTQQAGQRPHFDSTPRSGHFYRRQTTGSGK